MTAPTPQQVLDLELPENDADAKTVREYLAALARVGWDEKRPFGNSGWHHDLYEPLVRAGWVEGTFDEHGYALSLDQEAAERLIFQAFAALGARPAEAAPEPRLDLGQQIRHAALDLAAGLLRDGLRLKFASEDRKLSVEQVATDEVLAAARRFAAFIERGDAEQAAEA